MTDEFNLKNSLNRFEFFWQLYNLLREITVNVNLELSTMLKMSTLSKLITTTYPAFTSQTAPKRPRNNGGINSTPSKRSRTQGGGQDDQAGSKVEEAYCDRAVFAVFKKAGYTLELETETEFVPLNKVCNSVFYLYPTEACYSFHRP